MQEEHNKKKNPSNGLKKRRMRKFKRRGVHGLGHGNERWERRKRTLFGFPFGERVRH